MCMMLLMSVVTQYSMLGQRDRPVAFAYVIIFTFNQFEANDVRASQ